MFMPLRHILLPILSVKIDCPLRLKSASNACPIASCRRIPEAPAPITTGMRPPFGLRAAKRSSIPATALSARSCSTSSVSISAPVIRLLETLLFSIASPCLNTTDTETLPIGLTSQVSSSRELYIITLLIELDTIATTLSTRESRLRISFSSLSRNGTSAEASVSSQSRT